ncbi:Bro-N domain-containing protein [Nocardia sp. NPDC057227]|uniref:BRO-N domain-containing protein n=1 Tax=Nocardia sp. NPDC057227 TaxID=3346056 RepID=UPI0036291B85
MTVPMPFDNGEFHLEIHPHDEDGLRIYAPGLARALGFREAYDLLRSIPMEEKGSELVRTLGGEQQVGYVTEAGFYRVLGQRQASRIVDEAARASVQRFQSWVYGEVLPTIRKTGGAYIAPGSQAELDLSDPDTALDKLIEIAQVAKAERAQRLALQEQIEADRPMVERAKRHASGEGMVTRTQFFREVKAWAAERGVTVKQAEVNDFLSTRKLGLFVRGNRSDSGQATAWAIEKGYAENSQGTAENGFNYATGKLTAAGQAYAWERVVRFIDANATLELPREIGGAA